MKRLLLSLVCLTLVSACGEESSSGSSPPTTTAAPTPTATPAEARLDTLDGTEWIVTAIGDEPVAKTFVARLQFVNGNEIGGQVACDGLFLEYSINGSTITPTIDLQRTTFDCTLEEDPEDQGDHVYAALEQMASFTATESNLELFDERGTLLLALDRFLPPPLEPLLAGDWLITEIDGHAPVAGVGLTLSIGYESVGGFSGCNNFGGWRSPLATNALAVEGMGTDDAGCPEDPPGLRAQEDFLQSAVGSAASYDVTAQTLELFDASGAVTVRLEREERLDMHPADLIGSSWRLVSMAGEPPPDDADITLSFDSAAQLSGYAGCRTYTGSYMAEGDGIVLTSLGMGETDCERGEEYLLLEGRFTTLLGSARRYILDGDTLTILDRQRDALVFTRDSG